MTLPEKTLALPVASVLPDVAAHLAANRCVVLEAPPGSGKTTVLPLALLDAPWLGNRRVILLEPRRLAARGAAAYMASLLNEDVGRRVGYHIRLDRKISRATQIEIVTEGLLAQRFLSDEAMEDAAVLIFDEFHERSLAADQAFAMALEARRVLRPDLRIVVMSATMDVGSVAAHIGDAAIVRASGRQWPVETRWHVPQPATPYCNPRAVADAVRRVMEREEGGALVFLPGEGEIRATANALRETTNDFILFELYGAMERGAQDAALRPAPPGRRKIVLATSIAETSLTLDGIRVVMDAGWMRVQKFSPRTGMGRLVTQRVTRDRADQRRGRAGRQFPGVCVRLWDDVIEAQLAPSAPPEIMEADLALLVLQSHAWGCAARDGLPWMTPPPEASWNQAQTLLRDLGALDEKNKLTPHGKRMSRLGLHPRLSHCILVASQHACHGDACLLAAMVTELATEKSLRHETDARALWLEISRNENRYPNIHRLAKQWERMKDEQGGTKDKDAQHHPSIGRMLSWAFPDRIARRRSENRYLLASGKGAVLEHGDPMAGYEWLVVVEVSDNEGDAKIRLAAGLEWAEVADELEPNITEEDVAEWDNREERLTLARRRRLGAIVLKETPVLLSCGPGVPIIAGRESQTPRIRDAMLGVVRQRGIASLPWSDAATHLRGRMDFISRTFPDEKWPSVDDEHLLATLDDWLGDDLAQTIRWRDVASLDLCHALRRLLRGRERELDALAPVRMEAPSGSEIRLRYEMGAAGPVMSVRLQEVLGMTDSPRVARGRVPVTIELLSPAQRPIHITRDLDHFWDNGYVHVRKEMRGRYPRHDWPEDPRAAPPRRNSLKKKAITCEAAASRPRARA